jgi:purine-nucleoside phosphorylase
MVSAYDPKLAEVAVAAATERGVPVSTGVYAAMPGPMYETPAEIGFLRTIGASVVGMSVVPEVVPARALGMRVLGLFFVTNHVGVEVRHEDVVRASDAMAASLGAVIEDVLAKGDGWTAM